MEISVLILSCVILGLNPVLPVFTYIFKSRFVTLYGFYQIKYIQSVSIGVIDQVRSANDDPDALLQINR